MASRIEKGIAVATVAAVGLGGFVVARMTEQQPAAVAKTADNGGTTPSNSSSEQRIVVQLQNPDGTVTNLGSTAPSAGTTETAKSAENLPAWPSSAEEAAALFGTDAKSKDPKRWEKTADQGGWHFIEAATVSGLNPNGYILEGYYDTKPGKNPACFVSNGLPVGVQGATVWNVSGVEEASKLLNKMALPKWDDGKVYPCTAVGFTPTN